MSIAREKGPTETDASFSLPSRPSPARPSLPQLQVPASAKERPARRLSPTRLFLQHSFPEEEGRSLPPSLQPLRPSRPRVQPHFPILVVDPEATVVDEEEQHPKGATQLTLRSVVRRQISRGRGAGTPALGDPSACERRARGDRVRAGSVRDGAGAKADRRRVGVPRVGRRGGGRGTGRKVRRRETWER